MRMGTPELGKLEIVNLREAWESEDRSFTPWLADERNIRILGNALGMELEVRQAEASVGPFRADILCRDTATGELVVIENQLEKTDHKHLGQTVTYAAGLDVRTVVWVAQHFTDEHRAALDWLNRVTLEDFRFFGLEIELWRIGDSAPAPKFNLAATPNDWSKTFKGVSSVRGTHSEGEKRQLEFWGGFRDFLTEKGEPYKPPTIYARGYNWWGLGRTGVVLSVTMNATKVRVAVGIETRTYPEWFKSLEHSSSEIEQALGFNLDWVFSEDKKRSYISIEKETDTGDPEKKPEAFNWLLEHMTAVDRVFRPYVKELSNNPEPILEDAEGGVAGELFE